MGKNSRKTNPKKDSIFLKSKFTEEHTLNANTTSNKSSAKYEKSKVFNPRVQNLGKIVKKFSEIFNTKFVSKQKHISFQKNHHYPIMRINKQTKNWHFFLMSLICIYSNEMLKIFQSYFLNEKKYLLRHENVKHFLLQSLN